MTHSSTWLQQSLDLGCYCVKSIIYTFAVLVVSRVATERYHTQFKVRKHNCCCSKTSNMSAMMMTQNMASRVTFSKAGADACKLRSKVNRAPFVAGQAKQRRAAVVSVHAQKVRKASYP